MSTFNIHTYVCTAPSVSYVRTYVRMYKRNVRTYIYLKGTYVCTCMYPTCVGYTCTVRELPKGGTVFTYTYVRTYIPLVFTDTSCLGHPIVPGDGGI